MNVLRCDNCRRIEDPPASGGIPKGWVLLVAEAESSSSSSYSWLASALGGSSSRGPEVEGSFCGYACLSQYATAKALVSEAGEGT